MVSYYQPVSFTVGVLIIAGVLFAIVLTIFWVFMWTTVHAPIQRPPTLCPDRWTRTRDGKCAINPNNRGSLSTDGPISFNTMGLYERKTWAETYGILWENVR